MAESRTGLPPKEWPMCAVLRCDSQRERPCSREAATWRPATDSPSERSSACPRSEARGARIREFAWTCGKAHIAGRKCTSLQGTDIPDFFNSATGAHIAPFYLALARSAVCAPPILRCPSPNCDQTKTGPASRQHIPCRFVAVVMPTLRAYERASCVVRSTEGGTRGLRRLCPLFAEWAQEGGKQTGLSRTW
jgi:hypothetical protein